MSLKIATVYYISVDHQFLGMFLIASVGSRITFFYQGEEPASKQIFLLTLILSLNSRK